MKVKHEISQVKPTEKMISRLAGKHKNLVLSCSVHLIVIEFEMWFYLGSMPENGAKGVVFSVN